MFGWMGRGGNEGEQIRSPFRWSFQNGRHVFDVDVSATYLPDDATLCDFAAELDELARELGYPSPAEVAPEQLRQLLRAYGGDSLTSVRSSIKGLVADGDSVRATLRSIEVLGEDARKIPAAGIVIALERLNSDHAGRLSSSWPDEWSRRSLDEIADAAGLRSNLDPHLYV